MRPGASIATFVFFKGGEKVHEVVGANRYALEVSLASQKLLAGSERKMGTNTLAFNLGCYFDEKVSKTTCWDLFFFFGAAGRLE